MDELAFSKQSGSLVLHNNSLPPTQTTNYGVCSSTEVLRKESRSFKSFLSKVNFISTMSSFSQGLSKQYCLLATLQSALLLGR